MDPSLGGLPSQGPAGYNLEPLKPGDSAKNFNSLGPGSSNTPIKVKRTPGGKPVALGEIGKSGTYIFSGIITQEDYVADLTRWEAIRKYEIMRRSDATIAALLRMINWQLKATNWFIEAASEEPQDVEAADLVRQELFTRALNWGSFLGEAFLHLPFGYQVHEKVWEYTTFTNAKGVERPSIGIAGLPGRKQRSIYKWETVDHQAGITQYVPGNVFSIPMSKLLIFTFQKEGDNFEGIPLLRQVYKNWDIKDKLEIIDAMAHEQQGLGVMEVITPADAPQPEKDNIFELATSVRANEGGAIMHNEGYVTEFMDMKGRTTTDRLGAIEYHNGQIFTSILGQFIMIGQRGSKGASGARATSEDQSKFFEMGLEAIAKDFATVINNDLIKELCDYNFTGLKAYPTLEHAKIGDENIEVISTSVASLLQANGLTMDADTEQALRTILHLPDVSDDIRESYVNGTRQVNAGPMNMPDPIETEQQLKAQMQKQASGGNQAEPQDANADPSKTVKKSPKAAPQKKSDPTGKSEVTADERMQTAIDALREAKFAAIEAAEAAYERRRAA